MANFPLEEYFFKAAQKADALLAGPHNYCAIYENILTNLKTSIYPAIDIGLTKSGGIFTFHNEDHFDQVVIKAGELLGIGNGKKCSLTAYELFVLLIAIRIHDAGNCYGRIKHEKRCEDILISVYGDFPYLETERTTIASIAQAHGGENLDGSKDVIGILQPKDHVGGASVCSQRIAAIVRLADELAENNARIPKILLDSGNIPKQNEVYHHYARALQSNCIDRLEKGSKVNLRFSISVENAKKKFGKLRKKVFLIDEIQTRLVKMNQEIVYCNQFLHDSEKLISISAKVTIRNSESNVVWEDEYLIRDDGYPNHLSVPDCLKSFNSNTILGKLG